MSALGHKQTFAMQKAMSAFPPIATAKADSSNRSCLLYPRKRTCAPQLGMSALGHKRTHAPQQKGSLFDHLVGAIKHGERDLQAERFGCLHIDHELECGGLFHRQVGWFHAFENSVDVGSGPTKQIISVRAVGHERACFGPTSLIVHGWQPSRRCKLQKGCPVGEEDWIIYLIDCLRLDMLDF